MTEIRILQVDLAIFVGFLKGLNDDVRGYTVDTPLPSDAHYESVQYDDEGSCLLLSISSKNWNDGGKDGDTLYPPTITSHFHEESLT